MRRERGGRESGEVGAPREAPGEPELRFLPWLATAIVLPPALAAVVLAARQPDDSSWPVALALLGLWAALFTAARRCGHRGAQWIVALCSLALLTWPEFGLRAAGFRFDTAGEIQFGYPRPEHFSKLRRDPEIFWTLSPKRPGVNSFGFKGPEVAVPKPPGLRRMVFIGDSCMWQGYAEFVAEALNREAPKAGRFEAVNLGVPGYTSYQGRLLSERWLAKLEPDLAVIAFGWNDHWQAYGAGDSQRALSPVLARVAHVANRSRVVQWFIDRGAATRETPLAIPRVSLEEYRANLADIGERSERAGGRVLLLTAPSSHAQRGVPEYLIIAGFAASQEQVLEWHAAYNDAVRSLAAERGWRLLDLAEATDALGDPDAVFIGDGMHFTKNGLRWIGDRIAEEIARALPERGRT
jgi:lysophospholipase L1-like esterase